MLEKCSPKKSIFSLSKMEMDLLGRVIGRSCCSILSNLFVVSKNEQSFVLRDWNFFRNTQFYVWILILIMLVK